jgi:hypothetical protein
MDGQQLKAIFCERFKCQPADYEDRALTRCLYWHARLLKPVVGLLSSKFFAMDRRFIRDLGIATDRREANSELFTFQDTNRERKGFWRTAFRIRVSGRKASDLAQQLLSEPQRGGTQA